jgi:hypothetical protein
MSCWTRLLTSIQVMLGQLSKYLYRIRPMLFQMFRIWICLTNLWSIIPWSNRSKTSQNSSRIPIITRHKLNWKSKTKVFHFILNNQINRSNSSRRAPVNSNYSQITYVDVKCRFQHRRLAKTRRYSNKRELLFLALLAEDNQNRRIALIAWALGYIRIMTGWWTYSSP